MLEQFGELVHNESPILPVLKFFDGLNKGENRLRWDRMVCLHFLLIFFLFEFGQGRHQTDRHNLNQALENVENEYTKNFFIKRLPEYQLGKDPIFGRKSPRAKLQKLLKNYL